MATPRFPQSRRTGSRHEPHTALVLESFGTRCERPSLRQLPSCRPADLTSAATWLVTARSKFAQSKDEDGARMTHVNTPAARLRCFSMKGTPSSSGVRMALGKPAISSSISRHRKRKASLLRCSTPSRKSTASLLCTLRGFLRCAFLPHFSAIKRCRITPCKFLIYNSPKSSISLAMRGQLQIRSVRKANPEERPERNDDLRLRWSERR